MDSASDVSPQVTPPNEASGNGEHQPSEVKLKPLPRVYGKIIIVSSDEVRKRKRKEEKEARREAKKAREAKVGAESSSNGASSSSAKNGEPDEADSTSTTTKNESIPSTIQVWQHFSRWSRPQQGQNRPNKGRTGLNKGRTGPTRAE
jgi:hypothetical protein